MAKPRFLGIFLQEEMDLMFEVAKSLGMEDALYHDGQAMYCVDQRNLSDFWIAYSQLSIEDA